MRFALVGNKKVEASHGLAGACLGCGQPMIARCGTQRIHHWAHRRMACDTWWEPETEWHRAWKNNFPIDWQEVFLPDHHTGEKHIADVRTPHGLVIEFQHSHIDPKERMARERFYQDMVWVVDGTRLSRDYKRFIKGAESHIHSLHNGIHMVFNLDKCFPQNWLESTVPVIFDFGDSKSLADKYGQRNGLCCLFSGSFGTYSKIAIFSREVFVKSVINGEWSDRIKRVLDSLPNVERPIEETPYQANKGPARRKDVPIIRGGRLSRLVYDPKIGNFVPRKRF